MKRNLVIRSRGRLGALAIACILLAAVPGLGLGLGLWVAYSAWAHLTGDVERWARQDAYAARWENYTRGTHTYGGRIEQGR